MIIHDEHWLIRLNSCSALAHSFSFMFIHVHHWLSIGSYMLRLRLSSGRCMLRLKLGMLRPVLNSSQIVFEITLRAILRANASPSINKTHQVMWLCPSPSFNKTPHPLSTRLLHAKAHNFLSSTTAMQAATAFHLRPCHSTYQLLHRPQFQTNRPNALGQSDTSFGSMLLTSCSEYQERESRQNHQDIKKCLAISRQ